MKRCISRFLEMGWNSKFRGRGWGTRSYRSGGWPSVSSRAHKEVATAYIDSESPSPIRTEICELIKGRCDRLASSLTRGWVWENKKKINRHQRCANCRFDTCTVLRWLGIRFVYLVKRADINIGFSQRAISKTRENVQARISQEYIAFCNLDDQFSRLPEN